MNLYEHTIVARQDATASQIKQLTEKYSNSIRTIYLLSSKSQSKLVVKKKNLSLI